MSTSAGHDAMLNHERLFLTGIGVRTAQRTPVFRQCSSRSDTLVPHESRRSRIKQLLRSAAARGAREVPGAPQRGARRRPPQPRRPSTGHGAWAAVFGFDAACALMRPATLLIPLERARGARRVRGGDQEHREAGRASAGTTSRRRWSRGEGRRGKCSAGARVQSARTAWSTGGAARTPIASDIRREYPVTTSG